MALVRACRPKPASAPPDLTMARAPRRERYPLINRPVDETMPMPEVDNFYLDANGILHKSTHGDAGEVFMGAEGDQFIRMCNYIDTLVQLVRRVDDPREDAQSFSCDVILPEDHAA